MKRACWLALLMLVWGSYAENTNDEVPGEVGPGENQEPPEDGDDDSGLVEYNNQVFREWVPVAGTPFMLNYSSWRVTGNRQAYALRIPLYQTSESESVERVAVTVWVTNRMDKYSDTKPMDADHYVYVWDGKDAAGNAVIGTHEASYEVVLTKLIDSFAPGPGARDEMESAVPPPPGGGGYVATTTSGGNARPASSSGRGIVEPTPEPDRSPKEPRPGGGTSGGGSGGEADLGSGSVLMPVVKVPYTTTRSKKVRLGTMLATSYGLGGWTLTPHHFYDPNGRVLYQGNGIIRKADSVRTPSCVFSNTASGTNDITLVSQDGGELYVFARSGRHLRTLDSIFGVTNFTFSYDTNGYLSSVTDLDGNATVVERDAQGKPTALVSPDGLRTLLGLNPNGYLDYAVNPEKETNAFRYTASGLLTNVITRRGFVFGISYDSTGAVVRVDHPSGGYRTLSRSYNYSQAGITHIDLMQRTNLYLTSYQAGGVVNKKYTNPAGAIWETLSDYDGTVVSNIAPNGTVVSHSSGLDPRFDLQVPQVESYLVRLPSGLAMTVTASRAASLSDTNDLLSITALTNTVAINGRTNTAVYTAAGRTLKVTTAEGRNYTLRFDAKGRPDKLDRPGMFAVEASYDSRGRIQSVWQATGAIRRVVGLGYATDGYLGTMTNGLSQVVRLQADQVGRVTNVVRPDTQAISLLYDDSGNLTGVTPPGRTQHAMGYTSVSLMDRYSAPSVGVETNMLFTWNVARQLTSVKYPDGRTVTNEYAQSGLRTASAWPENRVLYTYNCNCGQIGSMVATNGGITNSFTYDGSLLTKATWGGPVTGSVGFVYNNDLRLSQLSVNGSTIAQYAYDRDLLATNVGSLALRRDMQNGLLTNTVLSNVTDSRAFDGFLHQSAYASAYGTTNLLSFDYGYDPLGRITSRTERVLNVTNVYTYSYDTAGRLAQVKTNGAVWSSYQYDANGNRTNATVGGVAAIGYYDAQDRLTNYGSAVYQYTASGTLTNKTIAGQTTRYRYDTRGNLLNVVLPAGTSIDYTIDALGRRIGKKVNGVLSRGYLYVNRLKPIAEVDGALNVVSYFVYGTRSQTPDYMVRSGTTYRILSDHLGSVRLVVNATNGVVAQRIDYDEWGRVLTDTNPGFQPFGFAGGLYDPDTGLVRFGYRDYDPNLGRWLAKDPILFGGGQANLYLYCHGDPINFLDPFGLGDNPWWEDTWDWVYDHMLSNNARDEYVKSTSPEEYEEDLNNFCNTAYVAIGIGAAAPGLAAGATLYGPEIAAATAATEKAIQSGRPVILIEKANETVNDFCD